VTDAPPVSQTPALAGTQREARIPMDDGVELAGTLYLPDPSTGPQPCILEALPYRKDDLTASYRPDYARFRDEYGYAVCRLDLRGTGSSGGVTIDEYPPGEQQDLHAAIRWLADQAWCDGNIGMYGTSYSGFNSLQMACERPEHLKAIISTFASDNRYTDDVHYRGGIRKFIDLVDYCHYMTPMSAAAAGACVVGRPMARRMAAPDRPLRALAVHPASPILASSPGGPTDTTTSHTASSIGCGPTTYPIGCWPGRGRTQQLTQRNPVRGSTRFPRWGPGGTAGCGESTIVWTPDCPTTRPR
jgi:pimeloyl-ACP methyl ester carboxylesterase